MLRKLASDGLFEHVIKPHSLDKVVRHNYYAQVFATAMKNRWPQRAYLGLYSGPGRARIDGTGEIVEASPLGAMRLPDPFTHYIFVDRDPRCTAALEQRAATANPEADVTVITGDVNDVLPEITGALPHYSKKRGLISFCFVDPYAANLRFATIRELSRYKMDFLILLMLGRDVRTNFPRYYEDTEDTRIAELIDSPDWREEYRASGESVVRFLLRKFDEAMTTLGYRSSQDDLIHQVKIARKNVFLYSLVFYSRHELGQTFWRDTLRRADPQIGFDLGV
jgi:three-Cys-motif partner protein